MEDFDWVVMTLLCIVVGFLLFQGATLFIQKGFKLTPSTQLTEFEEAARRKEQFQDEVDRQIDSNKREMDKTKRDAERNKKDLERQMREIRRQSRR